jgi:hypothetical protein
MGMDAGLISIVTPLPQGSSTPETATDVSLASNAVVTGFLVPADMTLVEAGVVFTVAGTTTPLVWKLTRSADTQSANYADVTGTSGAAACTAPTATVAAGAILKKSYDVVLNKGDFCRFEVTTATTSALGYFYALGYPAGGIKQRADELISTT